MWCLQFIILPTPFFRKTQTEQQTNWKFVDCVKITNEYHGSTQIDRNMKIIILLIIILVNITHTVSLIISCECVRMSVKCSEWVLARSKYIHIIIMHIIDV